MLNSGESYTIKNIFKDENKIVIPDMQREYCWAQTKSEIENRPLVEIFINDLIVNNKKDDTQMGLLYAYENPKDDYQLCDGQQRLTTLYLLLGVLYRKFRREDLKDILISSYELEQDDKEPRLQYAIRESTLFFLRDLVYYYFLGNSEQDVSDCNIIKIIKKQFWYFSEYDLDPSIQNILKALKIIEDKLKNYDQHEHLTDYVLNHVKFLYFDMKDRVHGEQQFVVINTTGKPLSVTENLKPRMLGNLDDGDMLPEIENKTKLEYYSDMWEDWEQYFWDNKCDENQVSDVGFKEFLRWITIIKLSEVNKLTEAQSALQSGEFEFDTNITLDEIDNYFKSLKWLFKSIFIANNEYNREEENLNYKNWLSPKINTKTQKNHRVILQEHCFILLPLLKYVKLFGRDNLKEAKRLNQFLTNLMRISNVTKAVNDLVPRVIGLIDLMKDNNISDIADLVNLKDRISDSILTKEEIFKFNVYKNNSDKREQYQDLFWKSEKLNCCKGRISYLFEIIGIDIESNNYQVDLNEFNKIKSILEFTIEKPKDLMLRALLTYGDYSLWNGTSPNLGGNKYSLGTDSNFFRIIMQDISIERRERAVLKNFLSDIFSKMQLINGDALDNFFNTRITTYENKSVSDSVLPSDAIYKLITDSSHLRNMSKKLYCISGNKEKVHILQSINVTKSQDSFYLLWQKESNTVKGELN